YSGHGSYTQLGGAALGARDFIVAANAFAFGATNASSGTVNLSGGTLAFSGTAVIGGGGSGTFNHSGGTFTAGQLILAQFTNGTNAASSGAYNMSNGATLQILGVEQIGAAGTGLFTQTGGNHLVTGNLDVGGSAGSIGIFNLSADTGPSFLTVN